MENESKKVPEMLTIPQVAERTGFSSGIIRRMVRRGDVTAIKAGRRVYVNFDKFLEFLNGQENKQPRDDGREFE